MPDDFQHDAPTVIAPAPYQLHRLGMVMQPQPNDPLEAGGVLNPGGVRAPNGEYWLFPRLVAEGNYSRIGVARVIYDSGVPTGVERLGIALEPEQPYEKNNWTGGGCEDARVVHVPALGVYVMTYAAFGPAGPRSAMAISTDLLSWTRLGLIDYAPFRGVDMNIYDNKDHMVFPEPVIGPDGRPAIALLHRPGYAMWAGDLATHHHPLAPPPGLDDDRWSIWISYCPLEEADWAAPRPGAPIRPARFGQHHVLIAPQQPWEAVRIGGGTPPVLLPHGWFTIYHGIEAVQHADGLSTNRYTAAALELNIEDPRRVLYRSPKPTLEPTLPEERFGVVGNVVFPTAVEQHDTYLDVYYGMADDAIGVARMTIPPA
jgi:predicted GH43/DUF377 family glycosyl hydrolase